MEKVGSPSLGTRILLSQLIHVELNETLVMKKVVFLPGRRGRDIKLVVPSGGRTLLMEFGRAGGLAMLVFPFFPWRIRRRGRRRTGNVDDGSGGAG